MNWTVLNKNLAYKKQRELLTISTQIITNDEGNVIGDISDGYGDTHFMILDQGSVYIKDWIDLRQFNNSCNLIQKIRGINEILGNQPLPEDTEVLDESLIKVSNIRENEGYSNLSFDITYQGETFSCEQQFIKYVNINQEISQNKVWSIKDLHVFAVNFQKVLFDLENKYGNDPMFLNLDPDLEEFFKK